jgi:hypothetical protein
MEDDRTGPSRVSRTFQYGANSVVFCGMLEPEIYIYILVYFITSLIQFLHSCRWLYNAPDCYTKCVVEANENKLDISQMNAHAEYIYIGQTDRICSRLKSTCRREDWLIFSSFSRNGSGSS